MCIEGQTLVVLPLGIAPDDIQVTASPGWTYEFVLTESGHYIIVVTSPIAGYLLTDEVRVRFPVGVTPDEVTVCLSDDLEYEIVLNPDTGEVIVIISRPSEEEERESNGNNTGGNNNNNNNAGNNRLPQTGASVGSATLVGAFLAATGVTLASKKKKK